MGQSNLWVINLGEARDQRNIEKQKGRGIKVYKRFHFSLYRKWIIMSLQTKSPFIVKKPDTQPTNKVSCPKWFLLKLSIEYKFEIIVRLRLKKIKNPWHMFCEFLHAAGGLAKRAYHWDTPFTPGNVIGCFSVWSLPIPDMYKGTAFQFEFVSKRILQRHLR